MPFANRFEGASGRRALWLLGLGMVLFGLAELPALVTMSAHGTGVLGLERAGTTRRLNEILFVWGPHGRGAAEAHVFIDLGFIACYGLLLAGVCVRLWSRYTQSGHPRIAQIAHGLAWAALIAATVNIVQKLILWLELHGHTAQPLPALASLCAAITSLLAIAVVLFVVIAALAARRLGLGSAAQSVLRTAETFKRT
jgi:hypothetical protein